MTEDEAFPAHLFPASFTLLYCPFAECPREVPFVSPEELLAHVEGEHRLVVENKRAIVPILDRYLQMRVQLGDTDLSPQEDQDLRERLQQQRLVEILTCQEQERVTVHRKGRHCLFCPLYCPTLPLLFGHMFKDHEFNIGQLDNLVMVDEFLGRLQTQLDQLTCIFCQGSFPNKAVLKKHIKNKSHFRIHPQNHSYDKYYVVNYIKPGKLYDEEAARLERDAEEPLLAPGAAETEEWEELTEKIDERTMCLLCPHIEERPEGCIRHMLDAHQFDWRKLTSELDDEYEIIKVINYLRFCLDQVVCLYCTESFETEDELVNHLASHLPHRIPDRQRWKDARFLFPIYEDDPLLCYLDRE